MNNEDRLLSAITMIESRLCYSLTLNDTAAAAAVSVRQLQRLFSDYIGISILSYINARRLTEASMQLVKTQQRVIDIALDFQFSTHESFTRAFTREFKLNPSQFREKNKLHHPNQTFKITPDALEVLKNGLLGTPRMVAMPSKKIVGFRLLLNDEGFSTPESHAKTHQCLSTLAHIVEKPCSPSTTPYWITKASQDLQTKAAIAKHSTSATDSWCFVGTEPTDTIKKTSKMRTYNIPRSKYAVFFQHIERTHTTDHSQLNSFCDNYATRWLYQNNIPISSSPWLQRVLSLSPYIREIYIPLSA